MIRNTLFYLLTLCFTFTLHAQQAEFYGPFPNWTNLKKVYNAKGDGRTDDTKSIQQALDELGETGHSPVLFIPNGTYRITSTLIMKSKKGIAIYGEDPLKTIIKWDGAANEKMFFLNGVSYSEYGRITWDGSKKALVAYAHEWDGKVNYANSGSQHLDEVFKDVSVGIKSGINMDAEMSIRRCRFYNCNSTAISLQGPNALDWWIWDCYFEKCNVGVANNFPAFGAGNFQVYRCVFNRSLLSDIFLGNSNFFSFRDNISFNSNSFLKASQFSNTSPITIQNNTIISDSDKVMMDLFTKGNILVIGNRFITPDGAKNFVIRNVNNFKGSTPDITFISNSFSSKDKLMENGGGRVAEMGTASAQKKMNRPDVKPYPFAETKSYSTVELKDTTSSASLQTIINKISSSKKTTILHFQYGNFQLVKQLIIPPATPLILTGDGLRSVLTWKRQYDTTSASLIQVNAPAQMQIKNMWIQGNGKTDGVVVTDDDRPGNMIYGNQLMVFNGLNSNVSVRGFSNTILRFENFQHNYCRNGISVNVEGAGSKNSSMLKIFGGESAVNNNSYAVDKGAKLLVYDTWYEGNSKQFLSLKGNGEFYLNGAKIAVSGQAPDPFINIESFSGKAVIAQAIYNSPKKKIYFNNNFNNAKFLTIGTLTWTDSTNNFYDIRDKQNKFSMYNNRFNTGKGSYPLQNLGNADPFFVNDMLSTIVNTSVAAENQGNKKASLLIFDHVMMDGSKNNLRIEK
ncbi:MAG: hypothetical protein HYR66_02015 [Sphingobacteriales bacterium]|nr:hypothetical protein [Sphingobacteriales bacterium]MBI3717331.1 hypothetical protein [Sphingobacteriales bacterium]